ncbi:hypothetical protein V493_06373 [Pseudogymnoascus sp. VKM F-4281 (FW-2241)]|nr:hypothetical protein V493_06373 [Pseudogymnoascus sp. VKM F-4281 (FW-2241)]
MICSRYLVGASIVSLAAAITPYSNKKCGPAEMPYNATDAEIFFDDTDDAALFVRCAETTYNCSGTLDNPRWFTIDSTNETVPANCFRGLRDLKTSPNYTGPLELPGLTGLYEYETRGFYAGDYSETGLIHPSNITSIDLPDLVNITTDIKIEDADMITSLNFPKLREVHDIRLNLSGGPAINLTFPSLTDVNRVAIFGEIDALDFPVLNETRNALIVVSTGNLDCTAFGLSVVNTTISRDTSQVICESRKGRFTFADLFADSQPDDNSGAFKIRGGFLTLTALLALATPKAVTILRKCILENGVRDLRMIRGNLDIAMEDKPNWGKVGIIDFETAGLLALELDQDQVSNL